MSEYNIGVLGASSLVGACLLSRLTTSGHRVVAFSREIRTGAVDWRILPAPASLPDGTHPIAYWICVAPIWALPEHFKMLESYGARKVVALSSTSRFTKDHSPDSEEQLLAKRIADAKAKVQHWAKQQNIEWIILRPTLIYGLGQDRNITEIIRLIRRFGFFPLFGAARGLRQPVHAEDVASACIAALQEPAAANRAFNISGAETLSYRDMVTRIFIALGRRTRVLSVPLWIFRLIVTLIRFHPRYRHWSVAMAERMNQDLVFDHTEAAHVIGFRPRKFILTQEDLP